MSALSFLSNYSMASIIAFLMIKNFTVPQGYQSEYKFSLYNILHGELGGNRAKCGLILGHSLEVFFFKPQYPPVLLSFELFSKEMVCAKSLIKILIKENVF